MNQNKLDWLWIIIFGLSGLGFIIFGFEIVGFIFTLGLSLGYLYRRVGETSQKR